MDSFPLLTITIKKKLHSITLGYLCTDICNVLKKNISLPGTVHAVSSLNISLTMNFGDIFNKNKVAAKHFVRVSTNKPSWQCAVMKDLLRVSEGHLTKLNYS